MRVVLASDASSIKLEHCGVAEQSLLSWIDSRNRFQLNNLFDGNVSYARFVCKNAIKVISEAQKLETRRQRANTNAHSITRLRLRFSRISDWDWELNWRQKCDEKSLLNISMQHFPSSNLYMVQWDRLARFGSSVCIWYTLDGNACASTNLKNACVMNGLGISCWAYEWDGESRYIHTSFD